MPWLPAKDMDGQTTKGERAREKCTGQRDEKKQTLGNTKTLTVDISRLVINRGSCSLQLVFGIYDKNSYYTYHATS